MPAVNASARILQFSFTIDGKTRRGGASARCVMRITPSIVPRIGAPFCSLIKSEVMLKRVPVGKSENAQSRRSTPRSRRVRSRKRALDDTFCRARARRGRIRAKISTHELCIRTCVESRCRRDDALFASLFLPRTVAEYRMPARRKKKRVVGRHWRNVGALITCPAGPRITYGLFPAGEY